MKPEPLKGKKKGIAKECFIDDDIRSAVEWLRQDFHESFKTARDIQGDISDKQLKETLKLINKAIDKAFEDVVKTTKEKGK